MNFIFETDTLDFVSPSIYNHCSIVVFENEYVGWRALFRTFIDKIKSKLLSDQTKTTECLIEWIIPAVTHFVREKAELRVNVSENYLFDVSHRKMCAAKNFYDVSN